MFKILQSMSLMTRIALIMVGVLFCVLTLNYTVFTTGYRGSAEDAMAEKAAAFTAVADETKNHVANLNNKGVFNTATLLDELAEERKAGKSYTESRIFGTIPVVAGWKAAQEAAARENIDFRISSFDARNPENEPEPGSFAATLLEDLNQQVSSGGNDVVYRIDNATNEMHYMRAIRLSADCMMCHGKPGNRFDTDQDGKDPLGFAMESWKVGDMHGAYHVVLPVDAVDQQVASFIGNGLMWTLPVVVGALLLLVTGLRYYFRRPIHHLVERAERIASGDLTGEPLEIRRHDELGSLTGSMNQMSSSLTELVTQLSSASKEVAGAATEIAATSEQMACGMKDQTEQTLQVSSAIEEMSATVAEVAQKSADASDSAAQAGQQAGDGGRVVEQTVEGMRKIAEMVNTSSQSINELGKRGDDIGQVIDVITEIADQINLLALNAAIEAARAGEHGRGFAVVADEVRKLAERTTQATEEVANSIKVIQEETGSAVEQMGAGTQRVDEGVTLAERAGDSLLSIVDSSNRVASMVQAIAASSEQQRVASDQISRSVETINTVTKQSAEGAEQAAIAATHLSDKAEELQVLVDRFKVRG